MSTLVGEVITSIDFDDKSCISAIELGSVDANGMLHTELLVASTSIAEQLPEDCFISVLTLT